MSPRVRIHSLACLIAALALIFAPGCSQAEGPPGSVGGQHEVLASSVRVGGRAGGVAAPEPARQMALLKEAPERRIIRSGSLTLEVRDLDVALAALRKETAAAGGYISNESHSAVENGVRSAEITCRLPVARFDATVGHWRTLGREEAFSLNAEDISEPYSDTEVSLSNQKRLETRLLELLNRQTNRLSDLLEIEKEAARVRSEIETLEARKRVWDSQLTLANLVISLHEPRPAVAGSEGGPLHTLAAAFLEAAENFVTTVAELIALMGVVVPLLVAAVASWLLLRALWRRRRRIGRTPATQA